MAPSNDVFCVPFWLDDYFGRRSTEGGLPLYGTTSLSYVAPQRMQAVRVNQCIYSFLERGWSIGILASYIPLLHKSVWCSQGFLTLIEKGRIVILFHGGYSLPSLLTELGRSGAHCLDLLLRGPAWRSLRLHWDRVVDAAAHRAVGIPGLGVGRAAAGELGVLAQSWQHRWHPQGISPRRHAGLCESAANGVGTGEDWNHTRTALDRNAHRYVDELLPYEGRYCARRMLWDMTDLYHVLMFKAIAASIKAGKRQHMVVSAPLDCVRDRVRPFMPTVASGSSGESTKELQALVDSFYAVPVIVDRKGKLLAEMLNPESALSRANQRRHESLKKAMQDPSDRELTRLATEEHREYRTLFCAILYGGVPLEEALATAAGAAIDLAVGSGSGAWGPVGAFAGTAVHFAGWFSGCTASVAAILRLPMWSPPAFELVE